MADLTSKHARDKDRLLDNISLSIKRLQAKCCEEPDDFRLTANLWQVQELCLHLDGTLSHGLKRLAGGYWPFVSEITHKSVRDLIIGLPRAVSNIVRGWAWLYIALNDSALESYLCTLQSHPNITKNHYLPHAMMRDTQRLEVLTMMAAGLEHLSFLLEPDNACLTGWKSLVDEMASENCDEDAEEAELASLESFASSQDTQSTWEDDQELGIVTLVTLDSVTGKPIRDDVVHSSIRGNRKKKKERININVTNSLCKNNNNYNNINNSTNVESSVCRTETTPYLKSKQQQEQGDTNSVDLLVNHFNSDHFVITDRDAFLNTILQTAENDVSDAVISSLGSHPNTFDDKFIGRSINYEKNQSGETNLPDIIPDKSVAEESSMKWLSTGSPKERSVYDIDNTEIPVHLTAYVNQDVREIMKVEEPVKKRVTCSSRPTTEKRVSFHLDDTPQYDNDALQHLESETSTKLSILERGTPEGQEDPMTSSTSSLLNGSVVSPAIKRDQQSDFLGSSGKQFGPRNGSSPLFPSITSVDRDVIKINTEQMDAQIKFEVQNAKPPNQNHLQGEVPLDSNLHLLIMLEVVADQEEKVYKIFKATTGHTVGVPVNLYVVLTDCRFYMTHWDINNNHYNVDASFSYADIEFLQLSLNYQIINVVCASPRRRYWLCTGNEETTRNIVSSLEVIIRRSPHVVSLPCVFTDPTMQSIAICKWVAEQTGCQAKDIHVDHYVLVSWEDPHAVSNLNSPVGPSKNGFLMYRSVGRSLFGSKQWFPGYFRLKAGVCYQFTDSHDLHFRTYVQLVDGECVGCRRVPESDRPHTFELILSGGRALQMAASSDIEASEWLQVFLQAVSQGRTDEEASLCVSACCILAAQYLFVCHEELETNFLRSLGKAKVQDVSMIHLDSNGAPYCILEFESVEAVDSCGDWVLHFSSVGEMSKFLHVLNSVWNNLYKVPLPRDHITDPLLQKHLNARMQTLKVASS